MKFPTQPYIITQPFGGNANTYYAEDGLKGHTGLDLGCVYGQNIYSSADGYVYSILNKDNPDLMRYRAVYTLVELNGVFYEVSYGHASAIFAKKGDIVKAGDLLMTGGNTGDVASGGVKVTRAEKEAGSHAGTHLHFQVRPVRKVPVKTSFCLYDGTDYLFKDNSYYEVIDIKNGYGGCVDPEPFLPFQFSRVLKFGSRGEDVRKLQIIVGTEPDGIFGLKTQEKVRAFQTLHNLTADGIVGPKTNNILNSL